MASTSGQEPSTLAIQSHIAVQTELLDSIPLAHPDRAARCVDLAESLFMRFCQTGDRASLDRATELARSALNLTPSKHLDRGRVCGCLASSLVEQFEQTGDAALLDEGIELHSEALALCLVDDARRALLCSSLAVALQAKANHAGDHALLAKSIELHREARGLRLASHGDRPHLCAKLASALHADFQYTGNTALVDEGMQLCWEALALLSTPHVTRAPALDNLALLLRTRFEQTGDMTLVDEAIQLHEEALALRPAGHHHRADSCTHLAILLRIRYGQTREAALLDRGIALCTEALALQPNGHPGRVQVFSSLSLLLQTRSEHEDDEALLEEAINMERAALALQAIRNPNRVPSYINLAHLTRMRFERYGRGREEVDEMTGLLKEMLVHCDPGHIDRGPCLDQLSRNAQAIQDYTSAINYLADSFKSPTSHAPALIDSVVNMTNRLQSEIKSLSDAQKRALLACCSAALDLVLLSNGLVLSRAAQLERCLISSGLGRASFMLASHVDNMPMGLQLLERARGVIWLQAVHMRHPPLDNVPPTLAKRLQVLLRNMGVSDRPRSPNTSSPLVIDASLLPQRDVMYEQRSQLQQILREIRAFPGLSSFMQAPDLSELMTIAARNPVVVLVAWTSRCRALVITSPTEPLVNIALPGINIPMLQDLSFTGVGSQQRGSPSDGERGGIHRFRQRSTFCKGLARLWRAVVKPILVQLGISKQRDRGHRPRIHWCPTGAFALVPIHAAGTYDGPNSEGCFEYVVSSYTPTLTALLRAQQGTQEYAARDIKLLLVAAQHAQDSALPTLWSVPEEVQNIAIAASAVGASVTSTRGDATRDDVIGALEPANVAHVACHGIQDGSEPHKSHFYLGGGTLSVSELMGVELKHAFFAFLSACETAQGDRRHTDEVVHLAATMLFAGFKSVVATMWAMNDGDGPIVAKLFYEKLFESENIGVDSIPYALDHAVYALRASGAPPERWATFVHMGA